MRWPSADLDSVLGVSRNPCYLSVLSLMMTVIPWKTKMNQGEGYVNTGVRFSKRVEGPRHHQFENLLQYVQKALGDIRRVIDWTEFDEFISLKKDSPDSPSSSGSAYVPHRALITSSSRKLSCEVGMLRTTRENNMSITRNIFLIVNMFDEIMREAWALSSFSTPFISCWKEVPSLSTLPKVGRFLYPRPLILMTMEG